MAASIREQERHAQQVFESRAQFLSPLRRHEEQHKAATAGSKKLATQGTGAATCLINFIEAAVGYVSRECSLNLPGLVQQMAEFIKGAIRIGDDGFGFIDHL